MVTSVTLLRYAYPDGRIQAALPLKLIEESSERLVGWLPSGSEIAYWATERGSDPRATPLSERFAHRLGTARQVWKGGSVLRVIPLEQPWQVLHFWNPDGTFAGWYVNLESEKSQDRLGVSAVDWHLDLLISAEFEVEWKDEEEAEVAARTEYLREDDLRRARDVGEAIVSDPRSFIDRLGRWDLTRSPEAAGPPLSLPPGWDIP